MRSSSWLLSVPALALLASALRADDGMWLLNNPPLKDLKAKHNFEPTPAWLEHVQKSSVRFNSGGSGSFVSADGLVITNHHVAGRTRHIVCTLPTKEEIPAELVGTDPLSDIAVLKLKPQKPRTSATRRKISRIGYASSRP